MLFPLADSMSIILLLYLPLFAGIRHATEEMPEEEMESQRSVLLL